MTQVQPGEILAGKYRIERVLGQGGMGVVVQAHHLQLDERIAIKFLLADALGNAEAVARFAREARAAVKIKSEHVARVSDVGTLENGAPYMVMEYLEGQDLSAMVHHQGALPVPDAVDFVLQAIEALAEAHALGIVHRDLKPANLFLIHRADGSPCVKVLDFGISKVINQGSSGADFGMTKTQAVMGSPLYMSPEQMASSRNVDGRTDIWAVGAILYELVTGRVPFTAETMPQLCAMILQEPPTPPRNYRPDLPDGLQQIIFRCLEKNRDHRFQNVAELASALTPWGSRTSARSAERVSKILSAAGISVSQNYPTGSIPPEGAATQSAWGQTGANSRGPWPFVVGAVALATIAAGAFVVLRLRSGSSPVAEVSSAVVARPSATQASLGDVPPTTTPPSVSPVATLPVASAPADPGAAPSAGPSSSASPRAVAPVAKPAPAARPVVRAAPAKSPTAAKPAPPPTKPRAAIDPLDGRR